MSFAKASDLLRLAEMATARYGGVGLADIETEFGVDRRTAQRMTRALEATFPGCTTATDDARRKLWRLNAHDARLMLAQGIRDSELTALELAIRRAGREGASPEVRALSALRDRLLAAMPGPHARRAKADAVRCSRPMATPRAPGAGGARAPRHPRAGAEGSAPPDGGP